MENMATTESMIASLQCIFIQLISWDCDASRALPPQSTARGTNCAKRSAALAVPAALAGGILIVFLVYWRFAAVCTGAGAVCADSCCTGAGFSLRTARVAGLGFLVATCLAEAGAGFDFFATMGLSSKWS